MNRFHLQLRHCSNPSNFHRFTSWGIRVSVFSQCSLQPQKSVHIWPDCRHAQRAELHSLQDLHETICMSASGAIGSEISIKWNRNSFKALGNGIEPFFEFSSQVTIQDGFGIMVFSTYIASIPTCVRRSSYLTWPSQQDRLPTFSFEYSIQSMLIKVCHRGFWCW